MWSRCGLLWYGCSPVAVSPWSRRGLAVPLLWFRCGLSVVSLRSLCDLTVYSLKHLCALRVQQHPAALMSPSDFAAVATLAVSTIFFICSIWNRAMVGLLHRIWLTNLAGDIRWSTAASGSYGCGMDIGSRDGERWESIPSTLQSTMVLPRGAPWMPQCSAQDRSYGSCEGPP